MSDSGTSARLPTNIFYFEVLLYLSLLLDALSMPFRSDAFDDGAGTTPPAAKLITAVMILAFVGLVWLAARRRKNWARMVLLAALPLSILSIVQVLHFAGWQLITVVDMVSAALTALGLYFSFTGDARDWFRSPPS
jgi:hypothetical protein